MEVDTQVEIPVHTPSKIRFKEDVEVTDNEIHCISIDPSNCVVDLGLLSEKHHYEVRFVMTHALGDDVEIVKDEKPAPISVTDLHPVDGEQGHKVRLEIKCGNPGHTEQKIEFKNSTTGETMTLCLLAKIMANHLGTPALKCGVKILQRCTDDLKDHVNEDP